MPRGPRHAPGGLVYHCINRAAAGQTLFRDDGDYAAFQRILREGLDRVPMRVLAFCVMPNHFHLVCWPRKDGHLSAYLRWVTNTHTKRWRAHTHTAGHGAVYQGRFKSFPCQSDHHYLTVLRYVERNPLRANLVASAADWPWSSLGRRRADGTVADGEDELLHDGPVPLPSDWTRLVQRPQSQAELDALHLAVKRNQPFGDPAWQRSTARRLGLAHTLRPQGRPRKRPKTTRSTA